MIIENDLFKIETTSLGGHLTSIYSKKKDKEYLYQIRKDSWNGQDIFIFPFIARVKDYFLIDNKKYTFKNHGLIRYMNGKEDGNSYIFNSNDETFKNYPYKFTAKISYILIKNELIINYEIINNDTKDMPFMLGAHPAFKLPFVENENESDISNNSIILKTKGKIIQELQDSTFSFMLGQKQEYKTNIIKLSKELFRKTNTIILDGKNIDKIILKKKDKTSIILNFNHSDFIAIWSDNYYGDYVCIEPWLGLPDYLNPVLELSKKPGIHILKPGSVFKYHYSMVLK